MLQYCFLSSFRTFPLFFCLLWILIVLCFCYFCVVLMLSMMHELNLLACRSRRALPALPPIIISYMIMRKKLRTLVLRLRLQKILRMRYALMSVVSESCCNCYLSVHLNHICSYHLQHVLPCIMEICFCRAPPGVHWGEALWKTSTSSLALHAAQWSWV